MGLCRCITRAVSSVAVDSAEGLEDLMNVACLSSGSTQEFIQETLGHGGENMQPV